MFSIKPNHLTILPLLVSLFLAGNLSAQNPLRPKTNSFNWQDQQSQRSVAPSEMAEATARPIEQAPQRDQFTAEMQNATRPSVELMSYQSPAEPVQQSNPDTTSRNKQALIASADKLPWRDPNQILDLIMKISLNLVFVLSFAFGAILLARRWIQPSSGSRSTERLGGDSLSVLQTLRIDPKTSIRLVQWRSNRFLIACDQNGIQSVNALNDSFDQTLTELETEDQLVSKLLATLELKKQ